MINIHELADRKAQNHTFSNYIYNNLHFKRKYNLNDTEVIIEYNCVCDYKVYFEITKYPYSKFYIDENNNVETKGYDEEVINLLKDKEVCNILLKMYHEEFLPELERCVKEFDSIKKYEIITSENGTFLQYSKKYWALKDIPLIKIEPGFTLDLNDDSYVKAASPYISKNIKLINSRINKIVGVPTGEVIIENSDIDILNLKETESATITNCKTGSISIKGQNINISNLNNSGDYLFFKSVDFNTQTDLEPIAKDIYNASTGTYLQYGTTSYYADESNIFKYIDKGVDVEPRINVRNIKEINKLIDYYFAAKTFNHNNVMNKIIESISERLGKETSPTKIQAFLDKILYPKRADKLSEVLDNYIKVQINKLEEILIKDLKSSYYVQQLDSFPSSRSILNEIYSTFNVKTDNEKHKFLLDNFFDENKDLKESIEYKDSKSYTDYWVSYQGASMETEKTDFYFTVLNTSITVTTSGRTQGWWND